MPQIARVGDTSDHTWDGQSGVIIGPGSPTTMINNIPVARVGDQHSCPIPDHGTTNIVSSPVTYCDADGMIIAVVGAKADCGATIITGSPDSNAQ